LNRLTEKGVAFYWDLACQEAFDELKAMMTLALIL
jgi:hypothetical protein